MPVRQYDDPFLDQVTVLGPCPGCDNWQVDYTNGALQPYVRSVLGANGIEADMTDFYAVIEAVLQEHLDECPHLRDLVEEYE